MMTKIIIILFSMLIFACSQKDSYSVIDFFWPMKVGNKFFYNITSDNFQGTHIIEIIDISKNGEAILIVTKEDYDIISVPQASKYSINYKYVVWPDRNIIEKIELNSGEKNILLKLPLKKGAKWSTEHYSKTVIYDEKNGKKEFPVKVLKGEGKIEDIKQLEIFDGKKYNCIVIGYYVEEELLPKSIFCKGLGFVGALSPEHNEVKWVEKIHSIEMAK